MLPGHRLLDTEGRAVFGRTPIEADTFHHTPAATGSGICLIGNEKQPRMKLFCDVMRSKSETAADVPKDYICWMLLRRQVGFRALLLDRQPVSEVRWSIEFGLARKDTCYNPTASARGSINLALLDDKGPNRTLADRPSCHCYCRCCSSYAACWERWRSCRVRGCCRPA